MTQDEAREIVIEGINHAAYRETDSSLHDADKNRLYGTGHYKSDRPVYRQSPWAKGNFVEKMAQLLQIANVLNRSVTKFHEAQRLLEEDEAVLGCVIRMAKRG